jgi:hypothetical protein
LKSQKPWDRLKFQNRRWRTPPSGPEQVAIFIVTLKEPSGFQVTTEIEAANYFTDDEWVTFWSSDRLALPEPVARFDSDAILRIEPK